MALAVFHAQVEDGVLRVSARTRVAIATAAIGAHLLTTTSMTGSDQLGDSLLNTAMALSCTLFLALAAGSDWANGIVRVLETRPFLLVGLVSYSLFLGHLPIILAMKKQGLTRSGTVGFS
ncbi:MAG: hypothetical protein H0U08_00190 [Actinobacteria bacterium]|nr:hypothetical protein [Actinomycetota bacterium]